MPETNQISNCPAPADFTAWLRAKADEAEAKATSFVGCSFYTPEWWLNVAAENRRMADEFDLIEGRAS